MADKIKVLTLDGGGVRGYLTAKILFNLETLLNRRNNQSINIGQRFDLLVGTSTGGIIASALAIGKSAQEVFKLYEKLIPKVFTPQNFGLLKNKYSNETLRSELENILGDTKLRDVKTHLCITSVDVENGSPRFHKSDYFGRNSPRNDEKLVDLALATSAAPTFFPLTSTKHSHWLADGGVVANNPSLVGLIDAIQLSEDGADNVHLLSVGTGEQCHLPYDVKKVETGGKKQWMVQKKFGFPISSPILELLMESQSKLAHYQSGFLLGDRYFRLNPKLSTTISLDDADKLDSLKNLADISDRDLEKISSLLS